MEIFIRLAGVQLGPYSEQQVRDYVTEGLLTGKDQAKVSGTNDWVAIDDMLTKVSGASKVATALLPEAPAQSAPKFEPPMDAPSAEPSPQATPELDPAQAAEQGVTETPQRAPSSPGVTHLPTRTRESGRIPLPSVVEALSKKTILIGPSAPSVPTVPTSSSGRTAYSTMTTSPMSKTTPGGTKQLARSAVKTLAAQTAPLPTKSISAISKDAPTKPPVKIPSGKDAAAKEPAVTQAKDGVTPHPTQTDDRKPRQSLLQSLTAKTVPMRTTAAPPLAGSGTIPVTAPLPTKSGFKPTSGATRPPAESARPPSVVDDLTKKLGQVAKPDPAPAAKLKSVENLAPTLGETETVKISLNKIKPAEVAATPEVAETEEETPKPRRTKRFLSLFIYAGAALVLLLGYYFWLPFHAAAVMHNALNNGDSAELENSIDFDSVRSSLKEQIKTQLTSAIQGNGATEASLADAQDMLDKSIDVFVTKEGVSGLVSKSGQFTDAQLSQTISFAAASEIFLAFNAQPVKSQGFGSINDFRVNLDVALLHLKLEGIRWKLSQLDLRPDLLTPPSPGTVAQVLSPVVATYMERGDASEKANAWDDAIADYSKALDLSPHSSVAYNARGAARQSKGDIDGAMNDFTQALSIDPNMAAAYAGRGNVKTAKNDLDGAIADYTQAINFDPNLAAAYDGRGNAKTAKDDLEGAITDYTQAISIDPNFASAYSDRGFARQANGNLDGAIADYTEALVLKPKTAVAYYNRGLARQSQGNLEAAIVDYDRALAFDPKIAGAYYNRGNAKNTLHDLDGAIADYTQAVTLNPKIALAYCNRGVARQAKGDLDGAMDDYTHALTIDPKIAIAYYNRGQIKQLRNDPDGAIADSSQALDLDPKNAKAYFNRGFAKLTKGNLDGAQDDLKQFCDSEPRDHDADHARLYLWLIGKAENSQTDADKDLSDALEDNWNSSPDDLASKTAAFLLGRISEADYLAAAASPDAKKDQEQHCEAWYFAGMKRLLMGDKATATDYFNKSMGTGQANYCEYLLSQAEIKNLDQPPPLVPEPPPPATAPPPALGSGPQAPPAVPPPAPTGTP